MPYTRANAWNNGGDFNNPDLLWYARGVAAMQELELDDTSSWWFFAAIHGQYVTATAFPGWGYLPGPPTVPTTPLPSQPVWAKYWDQCQHQTWYFPPWHRGYLIALEKQVRQAVMSLGGPSTWALPYWNYLGGATQSRIPPAFTMQKLPNGNPNPLYVAARYGPNNDGNIFVPIPPVSQNCLLNTIYTGNNSQTPPPGFGGPKTGFLHGGGASGNLESNPHNLVHVYVGGTNGLMSDPGLAALDPIFYLHHSNIDRLWAEWNKTSTNTNPTDPTWLNGPQSIGEHEFVMPMPDGTAWTFAPAQVNSLSQLDYTYEELLVPAPAADTLSQRLKRLGAGAAAAKVKVGATVAADENMELVGASQKPLLIKGSGGSTAVTLDAGVRRKLSTSLAGASETLAPDNVFLNLENVRGTQDGIVLHVYVNLPEDADPSEHPELLAGSVGLFGLRRASDRHGKHGGNGLIFVLDITNIIDTLHVKRALDVNSLQVRIVPHQEVSDEDQVTVGRVSIYRQGR